MNSPADKLPQWPQPSGIFKNGVSFDTVVFFKTIHQILNNVSENGVGSNEELVLEHAAFFKLLSDNIVVLTDETILFKVFIALKLDPPVPDDFFVEHGGHRYLRLDCLRTPADLSPLAHETSGTSESGFVAGSIGAAPSAPIIVDDADPGTVAAVAATTTTTTTTAAPTATSSATAAAAAVSVTGR